MNLHSLIPPAVRGDALGAPEVDVPHAVLALPEEGPQPDQSEGFGRETFPFTKSVWLHTGRSWWRGARAASWGRGPRAACMRIAKRASPFISSRYLLDRDIVPRNGDGILRSTLLRLEAESGSKCCVRNLGFASWAWVSHCLGQMAFTKRSTAVGSFNRRVA